MKRRTYILASLFLTAIVGGLAVWDFSARPVSAQKSDIDENLGVVNVGGEYSARDEFALTQGGANGLWSYGKSVSDADNTLNLFTAGTDTATVAGCGGGVFEQWRQEPAGDQIPQISRHNPAAACFNVPANALFIHPGRNNERAVLRFNVPASGLFQISGFFQRQNPSATSDLKIIKNGGLPGETVLYAGSIVAVYQQAFNFTAALAAGDKLDFSVGDGDNGQNFDGSSLAVTIGQPVAACLTAPADLQVFVPAENSPSDVRSVNPNAQLAGDAFYTNTGKVGRAFELDGAGDYVRLEDNAAQRPATALTVEGWFKFDAVPGGIVSLVSKPLRNSAFNSYSLYMESGQLRGFAANPSQYTRVFSNFTPQIGVWHHLAFTYDYAGGVSALKLYANGAEVTSGQDGTPNLPLYYDANPYPLLIGGEFENNAPGFFHDGQADEVSVYGRALSQTEIFNLVRQGGFGKCPPGVCAPTPDDLTSWYAGEQNALDSRSNNHGALQNGAGFAPGKVGQAFGLDGIDDRILIGDPVPASLQIQNEISLNAWIYVTQYPTSGERLGMIVGSQYDVTASGASIFLDGRTNPDGQSAPPGHIHFQIGDGSFHVTNTQSAVPLNQWVHISANRRGGEDARIYYNGVLQPSTSVPWSGNISYNGAWLAIGQQKDINRPFSGLIDEVSIFDRVLAESEVQAIVNANSAGMCKPAALDPAANQIAWFTGDGDARDFLGANPNGILRGDANFRVGRAGQAFNLDGAGDYIEVADDADHKPTAQLTAEGWFKFNNLNNFPHLVGKGLRGTDRNSYVMWFGNGNIRIGYSDSGSNFIFYDTGFVPLTGTFYHFAMVLNTDDAGANANTFKLYVNGAEVFNGAAGNPIFYDAVNPHPLTIGADINFDVPDFPLNGLIDEVSLYSRALSASEIAAVYNAGAAGKLKSAATPVNFSRKAKTEASFAPTMVQLSSATVAFAQVTQAGTTSQNGVDLAFLPPLPSSVTFTGLAYDIRTTAGYQNGAADDVQVCFNVPALANFTFSNLRILHLENGAWVNRSAAVDTSPVLCTDNLASLSGAFAIVEALAPTAANVSVSGKITDTSGAALGGVSVALTDSEGRSVYARSNNFGRYSFAGVAVGEIYIVSVHSKRYSFTVSSQAVNVQDAVENVDFTADSNRRAPDDDFTVKRR